MCVDNKHPFDQAQAPLLGRGRFLSPSSGSGSRGAPPRGPNSAQAHYISLSQITPPTQGQTTTLVTSSTKSPATATPTAVATPTTTTTTPTPAAATIHPATPTVVETPRKEPLESPKPGRSVITDSQIDG